MATIKDIEVYKPETLRPQNSLHSLSNDIEIKDKAEKREYGSKHVNDGFSAFVVH
jgi:hypothetical protein